MWTQSEAIKLARLVEDIAPDFRCHVALTGGCLYKDGERKDCDLLFYRIRQEPEIDRQGLLTALCMIPGFTLGNVHGWVQKALYGDKNVDLFFPDHDDTEGYPGEEGDDSDILADALRQSVRDSIP